MAKTVECWRCGHDRYTYESCMRCGASCKPLTKQKQRQAYTGKDTEWWLSQTNMCRWCGSDAIGLFEGTPLCQLHASTRNVPEADP